MIGGHPSRIAPLALWVALILLMGLLLSPQGQRRQLAASGLRLGNEAAGWIQSGSFGKVHRQKEQAQITNLMTWSFVIHEPIEN
jgi:hypothetical protein